MINGKSLVAESPEQVAAGIRECSRWCRPERVMVYTDCTLTGVKHIVAKRKIHALVDGTRIVRDELTRA